MKKRANGVRKLPKCKVCGNQVQALEEKEACKCHYHEDCLKKMVSNISKFTPKAVKIQSFDKEEYSVKCPQCLQSIHFTTTKVLKKCQWCYWNSPYRQCRSLYIFAQLSVFFGLLMLIFGVFLFWNFQEIFQLTDWKKYLLIAVFLFLILLLLIRGILNTYRYLGQRVENEILFLERGVTQKLKEGRIREEGLSSVKCESSEKESVGQAMTLGVESNLKYYRREKAKQKNVCSSIIYEATYQDSQQK